MSSREKLKAAVLKNYDVSEKEADHVIDKLIDEEKARILIEEKENTEDRIKARAKRAAGIKK